MQTYQQTHLTYKQAIAMLELTLQFAEQDQLSVAACVVDQNGRVVAKMVMDGTSLIADSLVEQKAYTALLGLSSEDFAKVLQDQPLVRESMLKLAPLTLMGGGLPLYHEGQLVGAFAVGGALVEQDIALASKVLEHFA